MDFSGRRLLVFRIQFSLVRQWLLVRRQFMRLVGRISLFSSCSTRCTPSTSRVCHLCVALFVYVLADPVSCGKYSGTLVFTAPVAEPTVVSYTVPLVGCTIVAIATIVTSCSSAALFYEGVCVAMSCGGGFLTPDGAYDSVWDIVKPVTGNSSSIISSTKSSLGVFAC